MIIYFKKFLQDEGVSLDTFKALVEDSDRVTDILGNKKIRTTYYWEPVCEAFSWSSTPQGFLFWENINNKWREKYFLEERMDVTIVLHTPNFKLKTKHEDTI